MTDRDEAGFSPAFVAALNDDATTLAVDRHDGPEKVPVLVCFGGLRLGLAGPPYEFLKVTGAFPVHRVFVRDLEQCWYQRGLPELGPNVPTVATALRALIDDLGASRSVFVGTSSGGYAAVMFGVLAGADQMVAFGSLTSLRVIARIVHRDRRWQEQVTKARNHSVDRVHLDLARLLRSYPDHGQVSIHYGVAEHHDVAWARRLARIGGVELVPHPGDHTFVHDLRDSGALTPILRSALLLSA